MTRWQRLLEQADITALADLDPGCAAPCSDPHCPCRGGLPS